MAIKTLIEEIESDVNDVVGTTFNYTNTTLVPNRSDAHLTFESGVAKKGKLLKTCVLYVDIRDSVALTVKHHNETMGKIYTAFAKAVLKVAKYHSGHIRNIIGDRVMIVFPSENCFTNAVDCAVSINHIAQYVINSKFNVDFQCGIGIDYGELRVIKVGIQRNGHEGTENKSLIWAGYPANIASRLTDVASKSITETYFEVVRNPINPRAVKPMFGLASLFGETSDYDPIAPYYLSTVETVEMTLEEFANNINSVTIGKLYMMGGNFISFSKKTRTITHPKILMTEQVYNGFKSANPSRDSITNNFWKKQTTTIKNVSNGVYGGDVIWLIK